MFHPHQHFKLCHFFFDSRQNFVDPRDPHDLCQSLTHATQDPTHQHYPRHQRYLADS